MTSPKLGANLRINDIQSVFTLEDTATSFPLPLVCASALKEQTERVNSMEKPWYAIIYTPKGLLTRNSNLMVRTVRSFGGLIQVTKTEWLDQRLESWRIVVENWAASFGIKGKTRFRPSDTMFLRSSTLGPENR